MTSVPSRSETAFTLLELLVVLFLLGVVLAIALPMFANIRHASELQAAEEEVIGALHRARWMAITSGRPNTRVELANCNGSACSTIRILDAPGGNVLAETHVSFYGATVAGTNVPYGLDNRGFLRTPANLPALTVTSAKLGSSRTVSVTQIGKVQG